MTMQKPLIKVLVVDDSAYVRKALSEMLMRSPRIEVIGTARDGLEALEKTAQLNPDVVTVDINMPELDGVDFLKAQMAIRRLPVVVCSIASENGERAVAAMEAGAIEFVRKPTSLSTVQVYDIGKELIEKVLAAASAQIDRLSQPPPDQIATVLPPRPALGTVDVVVIGVSTGGPQALRSLLPAFPADFPVPVAIVLHMPEGYTGPLAERLDELSHLQVKEASEGLEMLPGRAILARAGRHLHLRRRGDGDVIAHLDLLPENLPHRPAVDVLFQSAAKVYGDRTLGIVLTGMGDDGTQGSASIKAQGGKIYAEAESTCVVFGMPRSVIEAGLSDKIIPLFEMVKTIRETV